MNRLFLVGLVALSVVFGGCKDVPPLVSAPLGVEASGAQPASPKAAAKKPRLACKADPSQGAGHIVCDLLTDKGIEKKSFTLQANHARCLPPDCGAKDDWDAIRAGMKKLKDRMDKAGPSSKSAAAPSKTAAPTPLPRPHCVGVEAYKHMRMQVCVTKEDRTSLSYQINDQHYFTYVFDADGEFKAANFQATANADLDCDSVQSTFQRIAFGDEQANFAECSLRGAPAFYVDSEFEGEPPRAGAGAPNKPVLDSFSKEDLKALNAFCRASETMRGFKPVLVTPSCECVAKRVTSGPRDMKLKKLLHDKTPGTRDKLEAHLKPSLSACFEARWEEVKREAKAKHDPHKQLRPAIKWACAKDAETYQVRPKEKIEAVCECFQKTFLSSWGSAVSIETRHRNAWDACLKQTGAFFSKPTPSKSTR